MLGIECCGLLFDVSERMGHDGRIRLLTSNLAGLNRFPTIAGPMLPGRISVEDVRGNGNRVRPASIESQCVLNAATSSSVTPLARQGEVRPELVRTLHCDQRAHRPQTRRARAQRRQPGELF